MRDGLILQHAPSGPPGRLGEWAHARSVPFEVGMSFEFDFDFDRDLAGVGWIASLGSAHSATPRGPAWIAAEIELLGRAVREGVPVLGLCWGGQALAAALGATVDAAPFAEKGWVAIESADPEIPAGPWLHYHSERFAIPDGAAELASSPAGPAAFRIGPHLGLQFHPEGDAAIAKVWADKDPSQTPDSRAALEASGARWSPPARELAFALFDGWWARAQRAQRASAEPRVSTVIR